MKVATSDATTALEFRQSYLGLGSNLQDPIRQVNLATTSVRNIDKLEVVNQSSIYQSAPMGPQDQSDYINTVLEITTSLSPLALLGELQAIENDFGRDRSVERWGPRIIDIDILLFANRELDLKRLKIPHPGLEQREFVVVPLLEITPSLRLPDGRLLADSLAKLDPNLLQKL